MAHQGRAQFCVVRVGLAEGTRAYQEVSVSTPFLEVSLIIIYSTTRQRNSNNDEDELARQRVLNGEPHYPRPANAGRATPRRPNTARTSGLSYEGTGSNGENRRDGPPPSRLYARSAHFISAEEIVANILYVGCRSSHPSSHWHGSWLRMFWSTRPSTLVARPRRMFGGSRLASCVRFTS